MKKPLVVIADKEQEYIFPLVLKLFHIWKADIELEIITDSEYYERFFEKDMIVDLLIVDEKLYRLKNIGYMAVNTLVLTEESKIASDEKQNNISYFYRFSPLQVLTNAIAARLDADSDAKNEEEQQTEALLVTAASGGVGKTLTAIALTRSLNAIGKKTLYVDAEWLQHFEEYLSVNIKSSQKIDVELASGNGKNYENLKKYICFEDGIFYLRPCMGSLLAINKTLQVFLNFLEGVLASKEFRYVVVDSDSSFDHYKAQLMGMCRKVLVVATAQEMVRKKTEQFLANTNYQADNWHIVLNLADRKKSVPEIGVYGRDISYSAVIETVDGDTHLMPQKIAKQTDMKLLTYLLV